MADEAQPIDPPAAKRRGRPPAAKPLRPTPHQMTRDPDLQHSESGKIQVRGRDGEWLTRKRPANQDQFHIPPEIIPEGWDYQFNTVTVTGQEQIAMQIAMAENGWRPVPAGRHKGRFMPANHPDDGAIIRDGLRLEERPMALTLEARREEAAKAGRLMQDQVQQLGLAEKMPEGFSRQNDTLRRMERSGTSRTYAPEPGLSRPALPIEE